MVETLPIPMSDTINQLQTSEVSPPHSNKQLWESLQPILYTLDDDHDLPAWCILHDVRISTEAQAARQQREIENMNLVDRLFDRMIQDGLPNLYSDSLDHPGIDEELRTLGKQLILMIQRTREEQRLPPYTPPAILAVTYELWHVDYLHRNHRRDEGSLYSRTHLPQTAFNLIRAGGLTGLPSIIAALHHEDPEDLKIHQDRNPKHHTKTPYRYIDPGKLLCNERYGWTALAELFVELDSITKQTQKTSTQVTGLVRGVTKARDDFRRQVGIEEEEVLNACTLIRESLRHGLRVIALKSADALHNIKTLGKMSQKKIPKRIQKIRRAIHVFTPLNRVGRFNRMAGELLEAAFQHQNPTAIERFEQLRQQQLTKYLGGEDECAHLRTRLAPLMDHPDIEYIAIRPRRFRDYADPERIEDPTYTPQVDWTDPMFEIYVQVRSPETTDGNFMKENEERLIRIDRIRTTILETLKASLGKGKEDRGFSPIEGGWVKIMNPDLFPSQPGQEKTQLSFRIHDAPTEARNRRGYLGRKMPKPSPRQTPSPQTEKQRDEEMPPMIRAAIQTVITRTRGRITRAQFMHLLRQELLKRSIILFTPEMDPVILTEGATALDFANGIHSAVLRNCLGVVVRTAVGDTPSKTIPIAVNPLDPLPDGAIVNVVTRDTDPDFALLGNPIALDLGWLCFASSFTQERLRKILATATPPNQYESKGIAYLKRLEKLLNLGIPTHKKTPSLVTTLLLAVGDEAVIKKEEKIRRAFENEQSGEKKVEIGKNLEKAKAARKRQQGKLLSRIGKGEINPLELLALQEEDDAEPFDVNTINIEFEFPDLPNRPKELNKITEQLGRNAMNIETIDETRPVLRLTIKPIGDTNLYEVLRFILRLSYSYPSMRVCSTTFKNLLRYPGIGGQQMLLFKPQKAA